MFSGVKFIPRDQIIPREGDDKSSDDSGSKRRTKKNRKWRDKEEKRRQKQRRRNKYSSDDSEEGSDTEDSIDEEEEKELSRSKRRRKHWKGRRDFSDDDESSDESDRGRGSVKGKRRGATGDDEDGDDEEMGSEGLRASEVVRKEMGLEWMLKSTSISQAENSRAQRADIEEEKAEPAHEEVKKANPKEMNPYLRDNGSGYPNDSNTLKDTELLASSVVGDGGASWRLKALKRAKEQAAREGRMIEEVVEERWGSLGHLAASVSTSRVAPSYAHLHAIRGRKAGQADNSETFSKGNPKEDQQGNEGGGRQYLQGVSSRHHVMGKPKPDSVPWKRNRQNISSEDQTLISSAIAGINKFSNDGSFMEKINNHDSKKSNVCTIEADEQRDSENKSHKEMPKKSSSVGGRQHLQGVSSRHHVMRKPKPDSVPWKRNRQNISSEDQTLISSAIAGINKFSNDGSFMEKINNHDSKKSNVCTIEADEQRDSENKSHKEMPKKSSSVGTQKLNANQLAAKILQLRMKGKHEEADQLSREMEVVLENQDSLEEPRHGKERSSIGHTIKPSAADRRKREEDTDLHLANRIMHNKQYSMSKSVEDEYDYGDAPSKKAKRKNKEGHEEKKSTHRHILTQKERCLYCFENPSRPKHLVVAIGNFTYLMLPQFEPVVPGHCVILPLQHESATRTVDKSVWEEIRNFKKCLLKMFAQQDKDVVFMETVISLVKQRRHCMIECIPVPREVSNKAPMYFKKAIDEAEEEWSQHEMKKLIPTSGNMRQVIPENFAYFHVEFGLDRGFVHVIDDEGKFSAGFGLNVMRGVLRLPGEDMHRRRRHESMDNQKQAVATFMKDWEPFDWTKQLD